ncbi:hypothetical protein LJY25_19870 [Hymenobacter sp. BT175]|uniref:DUF6602 domain-containing protein n=1 Tax=Hymenobacter TaxID=89966 RepID=UPI00165190FD|nr:MULTISPECIES: DUF6602 domain-containing protein [Hymenobacter]MBC6700256.1 hypothetical protein [Hymenobacter sp. BT190]MCC2548716.1 hypothetical protein [Hymenobacter translucens]
MNHFDLKAAFNSLQKQMSLKLTTNRQLVAHAPSMGDVTEESWRSWLQEYLPKRYCVSKAFVVDHNGFMSHQIDLVIHDRQYSPFVWTVNGMDHIPAESVYAVFEVKQNFDKKTLEYAGEKIKSVRLLTRTNAPVYHADGCIQEPREHFNIIGGMLSLDSTWSEAFGEPFINVIDSLDSRSHIDIGCVLDKGGFNIHYNADADNIREISTPEEALIYFFLKLLSRLQKLGTVPAIDIEKYARALESM